MNQIHEEDWAADSWACHTGKHDGSSDIVSDKEGNNLDEEKDMPDKTVDDDMIR